MVDLLMYLVQVDEYSIDSLEIYNYGSQDLWTRLRCYIQQLNQHSVYNTK